MKNQLLLMVAVGVLALSCKKDSKPESLNNVVMRMKTDKEMKQLYEASKGWAVKTSIDIAKRRLDSAGTVQYLKNLRSAEHDNLLRMTENVKSRYNLSRYTIEEKKAMIEQTFLSFMNEERAKSGKLSETARFEEPTQPVDLSFPANPKNCYKDLIDDVSRCDRDMVYATGFALFGLVKGLFNYVVTQTAAFVYHSLCVDDAHAEYKKCKSQTQEYEESEAEIGDSIFQIWNPDDASDFIIIYPAIE